MTDFLNPDLDLIWAAKTTHQHRYNIYLLPDGRIGLVSANGFPIAAVNKVEELPAIYEAYLLERRAQQARWDAERRTRKRPTATRPPSELLSDPSLKLTI
ncbi:MAG: hypothetical protein GY941_25755 [Planctomycetes bacterium]|nr:hypothetical protein [Planctomycetota bacterium]